MPQPKPKNPPEYSRLLKDLADSIEACPTLHRKHKCTFPSRTDGAALIDAFRVVLFPGFVTGGLNSAVRRNGLGDQLRRLQRSLVEMISACCREDPDSEEACALPTENAGYTAAEMVAALPRVRALLETDVTAAFAGDPAARSREEAVLCYPGIHAIAVHRVAHELLRLQVPFLPRLLAEIAHSQTGIDIHPGATIGPSFFIDHGTGVVIGETATIGEHVKIYQGVTLGALSPASGQALKGVKRHPTIEDGVTIYANATILGGQTTIGRNSVIGGNVFLTRSVPPDTIVSIDPPALKFTPRRSAKPGRRAAEDFQI
jgi:serine O-acetyltransferase